MKERAAGLFRGFANITGSPLDQLRDGIERSGETVARHGLRSRGQKCRTRHAVA